MTITTHTVISTNFSAAERAKIAEVALMLNDLNKATGYDTLLTSRETGECFTGDELNRVLGILTGIACTESWDAIEE